MLDADRNLAYLSENWGGISDRVMKELTLSERGVKSLDTRFLNADFFQTNDRNLIFLTHIIR
jgi:hypothetical protein